MLTNLPGGGGVDIISIHLILKIRNDNFSSDLAFTKVLFYTLPISLFPQKSSISSAQNRKLPLECLHRKKNPLIIPGNL